VKVRSNPVTFTRCPSAPARRAAAGFFPAASWVGLDPVGVRVPALAEEVAQLRLGDDVTRRQTEVGKAPAHPTPGRGPRLFLRLYQGRAGRSAAVTDDLARVVAGHLPGGDQRDIHHGSHTIRP
jgi:hypothetical protein